MVSAHGKEVTRDILCFDRQADSSTGLQQTRTHTAHPRGDRPGFAVRPVSSGHFCGKAAGYQAQISRTSRFFLGCDSVVLESNLCKSERYAVFRSSEIKIFGVPKVGKSFLSAECGMLSVDCGHSMVLVLGGLRVGLVGPVGPVARGWRCVCRALIPKFGKSRRGRSEVRNGTSERADAAICSQTLENIRRAGLERRGKVPLS